MVQHTNLLHNGDDAELGALNFKRTVEIKTAAYTLTAADSGKIFLANAAASVVFTLPSTVLGLQFTIVCMTATSSGAGTSFSPAAADKIMGNAFTAADDKDAQNTAATDVVGDTMTVVGDGVDGWYITNVIGIWARE